MTYTYKVVLDAQDAIAEARRASAQIDYELSRGAPEQTFWDVADSVREATAGVGDLADTIEAVHGAVGSLGPAQGAVAAGARDLAAGIDSASVSAQAFGTEGSRVFADVSASVVSLEKEARSRNPFKSLVDFARKAWRDLTGGSIVTALVADILALYDQIDERGRRVFDGLVEAAREAQRLVSLDIGLVEPFAKGVGPATIEQLKRAGITTLEEGMFLEAGRVRGIGPGKAAAIREAARMVTDEVVRQSGSFVGYEYRSLVQELEEIKQWGVREAQASAYRAREEARRAAVPQVLEEERARRRAVGLDVVPPTTIDLGPPTLGVSQRLEEATRALREIETRYWGVRRFGFAMERMGRTIMIAGGGIVGSLAMVSREYLELDQVLQPAAATLETTEEMTRRLSDATIEMSISTRAFSAAEIARGLDIWGQGAGAVVRTQEDLNKVMANNIALQKLAAMNNVDLAETSDDVGGAIADFGLSMDDTLHVAQTFNYVARRTRTTVDDIGDTFRYVGPVASEMGVSFDELATAIGMVSDANIRASMAGRAFRQMFIRLVQPTDDMNETMNKLVGMSGALGTEWQRIVFPEGEFIGLATFIDMLAASTENLNDQQRNTVLATIATANELPVLIALVSQQIAARKENVNAMRAEQKIRDGIVDEETRRYQRLKEAQTGQAVSLESQMDVWEKIWARYERSDRGRIDRLKRTWEAAAIKMGEATLDYLVAPLELTAQLLDRLAEFVAQNPWVAPTALAAGAVLFTGGAMLMIVGRLVGLATSFAVLLEVGSKLFSPAIATMQMEAARTNLTASQQMLMAARGMAGRAVTGVKAMVEPAIGVAIGLVVSQVVTEMLRPVLSWLMQERWGWTPEQAEEFTAKEGTEATAQKLLALMWGGARSLPDAVKAGLSGADWDGVKRASYEGVLYGTKDAAELLGLRGPAAAAEAWQPTGQFWNWRQREMGAPVLPPEIWRITPGVTGAGAYSRELVMAYMDYMRQVRAENRSYQRSVESEHRDHTKRLAQIDKDYARAHQAILAETAESIEKIDQERITRTAKAEEDLAERRARIIEESNERLRQLALDHADKVWDLVIDRDARGLIREQRRYRRAVDDENRRRNKELSEAAKAHAEQMEEIERYHRERTEEIEKQRAVELAELEESTREQREEEVRSHEERLADLEAAHRERLGEIKEDHALRLAEIQGWEEYLNTVLNTVYGRRRDDLDAHLNEMLGLWRRYYDEIDKMWENYKTYTGPRPPGRGYVEEAYTPTSRMIGAPNMQQVAGRIDLTGNARLVVVADDAATRKIIADEINRNLSDVIERLVQVIPGNPVTYSRRAR